MSFEETKLRRDNWAGRLDDVLEHVSLSLLPHIIWSAFGVDSNPIITS